MEVEKWGRGNVKGMRGRWEVEVREVEGVEGGRGRGKWR